MILLFGWNSGLRYVCHSVLASFLKVLVEASSERVLGANLTGLDCEMLPTEVKYAVLIPNNSSAIYLMKILYEADSGDIVAYAAVSIRSPLRVYVSLTTVLTLMQLLLCVHSTNVPYARMPHVSFDVVAP